MEASSDQTSSAANTDLEQTDLPPDHDLHPASPDSSDKAFPDAGNECSTDNRLLRLPNRLECTMDTLHISPSNPSAGTEEEDEASIERGKRPEGRGCYACLQRRL